MYLSTRQEIKLISRLNPLTYEVDALPGAMLGNGSSIYGFGLDCIILLLTLSGRLYPRVAM
jgi:ABC-2 type transport system permease protein